MERDKRLAIARLSILYCKLVSFDVSFIYGEIELYVQKKNEWASRIFLSVMCIK